MSIYDTERSFSVCDERIIADKNIVLKSIYF